MELQCKKEAKLHREVCKEGRHMGSTWMTERVRSA